MPGRAGSRSGESESAERIRIDVMDGHLVPNLSIEAPIVQALRRLTCLPPHLMISDPDFFLEEVVDGAALD